MVHEDALDLSTEGVAPMMGTFCRTGRGTKGTPVLTARPPETPARPIPFLL
jgi:hypothetical protein